MINQLLHIKTVRADKAHRAAQQQAYHVSRASTALDKSQQAINDYNQWREQEERRRFAKAQQSSVLLKELDTLRQEIALLREREAELKQQAAEAKKHLEHERMVFAQKKKLAVVAYKATEKCARLYQQQQTEKARSEQYQEELDQEEFRTIAVM
ncbi:type III secretion system stalk subunit SctO [Vibrio pacinii]|uniref:type III secretion system stalk subunit SctO n=1 Tax=Vibrio pacinii TaxID=170674 RepID=UPI00056F75DC|nr:YscO family type III secretion system apparatus protein [Vibrio pacinii]